MDFGEKSLVVVTMTRVFSSNSLTRERERERERVPNQWNSATSKQKNKKKNSVARRIKRKEEQIEANLNEDQRRVASKQRRML